ncbi:hypothetical protein UO65_4984 [Actinokineospora spheciospongiae]|uniref:Uncharacterized protein n=1 Tax=Actinokineospora spheciospongiae TaxID=909613 RepID=W7IFT0_9PSEU|nr:hypothetical protein UO65_4984 [Actinokineospora spheciospongiae]
MPSRVMTGECEMAEDLLAELGKLQQYAAGLSGLLAEA